MRCAALPDGQQRSQDGSDAAAVGCFGHPECEDGKGHGGGQREKGCAVSKVIDDHAGRQPAERGVDPMGRGNGAQGQVVAPVPHDIGDHQRGEGAETSMLSQALIPSPGANRPGRR